MMINMFNSKYMKYVALSGLLGLFATMFGAIGDFQNYAFAQIRPAPQKHDGNSNSDQSSLNGPSSDADDGEGSDNSAHQIHRVQMMIVKVKIREVPEGQE